jgi:Domain of unknown function (DUF4258)
MKKAAPYILLLVMLVAAIAIKRCNNTGTVNPKPRKENTTTVNRDRGFDRRVSYIEYSKHADCRMDCRKISKTEVEDIMRNGEINYRKSDLQNARCPRYALEGITKDNQKVRIVFAQCNELTNVVTVIDLDTDWTCHCPGDDK